MCLKAVCFDTCSQCLPISQSFHSSFLSRHPNDPPSLTSCCCPKYALILLATSNVCDYKVDSIFIVNVFRTCAQKYATSMRTEGLSGEYATPLWCRPWLSSWLGKRKERGLWPKIVVVSACWQQQVASRHPGSKVIEFLSDYKLRIRHAWLQLMTGSYRAHSTQHTAAGPLGHI